MEKTMKFVKRMRKIQEEVEAALEMKKQTDRRRKEVEKWKAENRMILSMKGLMFKKRLVRKLVN